MTSSETPHTTTFDIQANESDIGLLLGSRGRHADALRVLFTAIFGKHRRKFNLHVATHSQQR